MLKRKPYHVEDFRPRERSKDNMLDAISRFKENGLFRKTLFGSELIWNDTRYLFPTKKGLQSMKNLFIFGMVKRDALNFLKTHKIKELKWNPSVVYNKKISYSNSELIGFDMDSAYWQIANRMKIISGNTFEKGYRISQKHILLAALSSLGRDKRYDQINEGKLTIDTVIIKGNDDLKNLYKKIRYACFRHMKKIASILGNDFIAYKTDCIYCLYSEKNMAIVEDYLDYNGLDYKIVSSFRKLNRPEYD